MSKTEIREEKEELEEGDGNNPNTANTQGNAAEAGFTTAGKASWVRPMSCELCLLAQTKGRPSERFGGEKEAVEILSKHERAGRTGQWLD